VTADGRRLGPEPSAEGGLLLRDEGRHRLRAGTSIHGIEVIDVGCMQVDLYYHPDAFALDAAFDPATSVASPPSSSMS
jgi:hypothetical protein